MKNIYKESDGVYRIELSNGFRDDGTRDRIVERVYGTENDAIKRRDEMRTLQQKMKEEGLKEQNSGYTLTQVAKLFLDDTKYQKRSYNTVRGYKQLLNNWILPELGDIKIRSIEEKDLEKLYDKMRNKVNPQTNTKLSETYVTHCHKLIKAIYNYAKRKKWILSNPADYVIDAPKFKSPERDYYGYDEMLQVYALLNNYDIRFKTAITLLFNTGLRRGELMGLKWDDVSIRRVPTNEKGVKGFVTNTILDINKEVITAEKSLLKDPKFLLKYEIKEIISDTLIAISPKTEKSERKIIVANQCYDLLQEYKKHQISNGFNPTDKDYIFRTLDNISVWNPNYLTKEWSRFIEQNDLKKITIHDIRHSHATYLLSLGIPPQDVARRLGHSEPATTLKIYTHSNLLQDQKIVDIFSQNLYNNSNEVISNEMYPNAVMSILLNNKDNIEKEELFTTLETICDKSINEDELEKYMDICKNYILDTNPELMKLISVTDKLNTEDRHILIKNIFDIYSADSNLKLDKINDISIYEKDNIAI